jgi:hypothetical protein
VKSSPSIDSALKSASLTGVFLLVNMVRFDDEALDKDVDDLASDKRDEDELDEDEHNDQDLNFLYTAARTYTIACANQL